MEEKKTKAKIICDAICGLLMILSIASYVIIGVCVNIWHPTWVIIVGGAIVCAVIGIVCDTISNIKNIENNAKSNIEEIKNDNQ